MTKAKKIILYAVGVLIILYLAVVAYRVPHFLNEDKAAEAVEWIHATQLTRADVMGESLPPEPGEAADATISGVDANENGIRDDVELAIFEKYPDDARVRAALLQYAQALQMEFTQDFVNSDVVIAVAQETSRASLCMSRLVSRENMDEFIQKTLEFDDFVKDLHENTTEREQARTEFYKDIDSYSNLDEENCDINTETL